MRYNPGDELDPVIDDRRRKPRQFIVVVQFPLLSREVGRNGGTTSSRGPPNNLEMSLDIFNYAGMSDFRRGKRSNQRFLMHSKRRHLDG